MTKTIKADLLVIGAGSGGLSVAAGAAQMGARVVLLEGGEMGGDCLNTGCVPSKSLLAMAKQAQATGQPDYAGAMAHVRQVISAIEPHDSQERFEGLGVQVIRAYGRFLSPHEVEAGGQRITARRIVIATGSRASIPPVPGLDTVPYLTNETLWALTERPAHLLILGGGPIGLELAQAHVRLGSRVTVIEAARCLGRDDPELAQVVVDRLRAEGVDILEHTKAERIEPTDTGVALIAGGRRVEGSQLLVATGRTPNTEGLNLPAAGIETQRGAITVDAGLRTSNRRVYAIGDVIGQQQFTHVAGYHAGVVVRSALFGLPAKVRSDHLPHATYTQPELAQIGLTEAEARKAHGDALEVIRLDPIPNDRLLAEGRDGGLLKLMVVKGRPVGVSIVGEQAGEQVATWSLILANRMKLSQVSAMVAPYPTVAEITKRAAGAYFSPRLFDNPRLKQVVRLVQRLLP
jgi:pyruvate/2-oxoglutarate dehydrogenase complex dihydrolipoamide dehydrogenase (E3) component